jgi:hypothetical protein
MDYLHEFSIDILCLSETKLSDGLIPLNIPGYKLIREDRNEFGGGVAFLIKDGFSCEVLRTPEGIVSPDSRLEIVSVKCQFSKLKTFIVSSIYRPKFNLTHSDLESLENLLTFLNSHELDFYACGDFNVHLEDNTRSEILRFNRLLKRLNLKEHIMKPTRGTARLDLIISNDNRDLESNVEIIGRTDHLATYIVRPLKYPKCERRRVSFRNFGAIDWQALSYDVVRANAWNECNTWNSGSINDSFKRFIDIHLKTFDKHAPITTKSFKCTNSPKYLLDSTKKLKVLRNKLYIQSKSDPHNPQTLKRLAIANKHLTKAIYSDTKSSVQTEIRVKGLWHVKKKFCDSPKPIVPFDTDLLNDYYVSICNDPIPTHSISQPNTLLINCSFSLKCITENELIIAYKKLRNRGKTSTDVTGLSPFMLQKTIRAPMVTATLLNIINGSFTNGEFPNCLKMSSVTPIPKVPSPKTPADFRPISSQPFLSLLLEKCAYNQIYRYFEENNLFHRGQFGFRKNQSCEKAMMALIECAYKEINAGNICVIVSLDLAKAFDTIVREFLISKLEWYGVNPDWFKSYLEYRCQYVQGKDGRSSIKFTLRGCPQGSVLGPLIFNIYINDLPLVVRFCICILFADDTQLFIAGKPNQLKSIIRKLEEDLRRINTWMNDNGMKLNVLKTQVVVLGNAHNVAKIGTITLQIDDTTVTSQETLKSLGLTIDAKLSWLDHINKLSRSFHLSARSLYPLRSLLTDEQFRSIFNACVLSKCMYMSVLWGAATNNSLKIIERRIRQAARILLNKKWQDPIRADIYSTLKWFLPKDFYTYNLLCFVYHTIHNPNSNCYFLNQLRLSSDVHSHETRKAKHIYIPNVRGNVYGRRSISQSGAARWNALPDHITNSPSLNIFRSRLKQYLLTNNGTDI